MFSLLNGLFNMKLNEWIKFPLIETWQIFEKEKAKTKKREHNVITSRLKGILSHCLLSIVFNLCFYTLFCCRRQTIVKIIINY